MPNIKGINLSDGITILDAHDIPHQYSASQIEAYLASHSVEQTETQITNWLNANYFDDTNDQCAVKILSVSPLKVTCIVAKKYRIYDGTPYQDESGRWVTPHLREPYVIPDNWWEGG